MTKLLRAVSALLNVLSVVARNKDEGGLADLLKGASVLVRSGDDATDEFERITAEINQMVSDGVDPTAEQLEAVAQNRNQLSESIQSVDLSGDGGDDEGGDGDTESPTTEESTDGTQEPA